MGCNCGGGVTDRIWLVKLVDGSAVWAETRDEAGAAIIGAGGGTTTELTGSVAGVVKQTVSRWTRPA